MVRNTELCMYGCENWTPCKNSKYGFVGGLSKKSRMLYKLSEIRKFMKSLEKLKEVKFISQLLKHTLERDFVCNVYSI